MGFFQGNCENYIMDTDTLTSTTFTIMKSLKWLAYVFLYKSISTKSTNYLKKISWIFFTKAGADFYAFFYIITCSLNYYVKMHKK